MIVREQMIKNGIFGIFGLVLGPLCGLCGSRDVSIFFGEDSHKIILGSNMEFQQNTSASTIFLSANCESIVVHVADFILNVRKIDEDSVYI
jgi:hypothetical protein